MVDDTLKMSVVSLPITSLPRCDTGGASKLWNFWTAIKQSMDKIEAGMLSRINKMGEKFESKISTIKKMQAGNSRIDEMGEKMSMLYQ